MIFTFIQILTLLVEISDNSYFGSHFGRNLGFRCEESISKLYPEYDLYYEMTKPFQWRGLNDLFLAGYSELASALILLACTINVVQSNSP